MRYATGISMSFASHKSIIEAGDTVVLYLGYDNMHQVKVESGKVHQTKYGALPFDELIGTEYGSKVQCSRGWLYVLQPTPELWTVTLPHRTQILYATDISMVLFQLDITPGSVVVESGTGSGSLSHAILRTIAPSGHLYTFDFHEQRVVKARDEFADHGLGSLVTVTHRDVCKDGFGLENIADAVFLDLPSPWEALPFAKKALKTHGGRICSFSPCIEQVQRTCQQLRELHFVEVQMLECLLRPFDVRTASLPLADLGEPPNNGASATAEDHSGSLHRPLVGEYCRLGVGDNADDDRTKKVQKSDVFVSESCADGTAAEATNFLVKTGQAAVHMPGHTGYLTFATLYPT